MRSCVQDVFARGSTTLRGEHEQFHCRTRFRRRTKFVSAWRFDRDRRERSDLGYGEGAGDPSRCAGQGATNAWHGACKSIRTMRTPTTNSKVCPTVPAAPNPSGPVGKLKALYHHRPIQITWAAPKLRDEGPVELCGSGLHRFDGPRF
jgi:hypothetical protein